MTEGENLKGQYHLFDGDGQWKDAEKWQREGRSIAQLERRLKEILKEKAEEECLTTPSMPTTASSPKMTPKLQDRSRSHPKEGKMLMINKNQAITQSEKEPPTKPSMPTSSTPNMTPKLQGRSRSEPRGGEMKSSSRELTNNEIRTQIPHSKQSGILHFNDHLFPFDSNGYCVLHKDVQIAKKNNNGAGWSMWSTIRPHCPKCVTLGKSNISGDTESMNSEESSVNHHRQHGNAKQINLRSSARDQHSKHSTVHSRGGWNRSNTPECDHAVYKRAPMNRSPRPMRKASRREHTSSRSSGVELMTNEESRRGNRGQRRYDNICTSKSFYSSAKDLQTSDQARGQNFARQHRHNIGGTKSFHSPASARQTSGDARGQNFARQDWNHSGGTAKSFYSSASDRQTSGQDRGQNFVRQRSKSVEDPNRHFLRSDPDKYDDYERRSPLSSRPPRPLHPKSQWERNERGSYSPDNADDHVSVDSYVSKLTIESHLSVDSDVSKLTIESGFADGPPGSNVICDNEESFLNKSLNVEGFCIHHPDARLQKYSENGRLRVMMIFCPGKSGMNYTHAW